MYTQFTYSQVCAKNIHTKYSSHILNVRKRKPKNNGKCAYV